MLQEDRERAFAKKLYNDGTRLSIGTRKMPPLAIGDKVIVQNQTGRAPNKWDKSGVIVECKPHNQVNVMMDGSRRVSLRNRQFVRKLDVPMPISGVKPSQFYDAQYCESDVQHHPGEDAGVVEHGEREGSPGDTNEDNSRDHGGIVVDDQSLVRTGLQETQQQV